MDEIRHNIKMTVAGMSGAALMGLSLPTWADEDDYDDEIPYAEAEIFFELNNTDGDLGIHALIDGDEWNSLKIEDPYERTMLNVRVKGRLRRQGLTEIFFESAEPTFDELPPARFFRRFPEGEYEISGRTLDWQELESDAELTHVMPAPPEPVVNGIALDQDCEDASTTVVSAPIVITWPEVTMSHPDVNGGGASVQPPVPVEINNYEVVVEVLNDEIDALFTMQLPPDVNSVSLPQEFTDLGTEFKYEVLAREESFNQTAVESCFVRE
ncbi:MAG: hypothetical protein ACR2Q3_06335 [Woeseiaceae bacterium]